MRKYFTDYQCIMILKRCVERVALSGRGWGRGLILHPSYPTHALQAQRRGLLAFKNMPFLHAEDALLEARRASSPTQFVTY